MGESLKVQCTEEVARLKSKEKTKAWALGGCEDHTIGGRTRLEMEEQAT